MQVKNCRDEFWYSSSKGSCLRLGLEIGTPHCAKLLDDSTVRWPAPDKNQDGQWKSSNSFSRNEIPLAAYCLQKSFEHIIGAQQNEEGSVEEETVY